MFKITPKDLFYGSLTMAVIYVLVSAVVIYTKYF